MMRGLMHHHDFRAYLLSCCPLSLCTCQRLVGRHPLSLCSLLTLQSSGYCLPPLLSLHIFFAILRLTCNVRELVPYQSSTCSAWNFSLQPLYGVHECSSDSLNLSKPHNIVIHTGGGRAHLFPYNEVIPHAMHTLDSYKPSSVFSYVDHVHHTSAPLFCVDDGYVIATVPFQNFIPHISVSAAMKIARHHKIPIGSHVPKNQLMGYFADHNCPNCTEFVSVFLVKGLKDTTHDKSNKVIHSENMPTLPSEDINSADFPPPPLTPSLTNKIITDFCNDCTPNMFQEAGCAICGQLTPISKLSKLRAMKGFLGILEAKGVTRVECRSMMDPIRELRGPVIDHRCDKICLACRSSIRKSKVPEHALANGLWIGEVPEVLSNLRFIEKLLIARLRHNCCFVRVASGMRKMTSHVVAFQAPIPKLYHALPPPIEDIDEVLAILFTGPTKPTQKDFERTPLLVRRNAVAKALEWLKLNHVDYKDLEISYEMHVIQRMTLLFQ